MPQTLNPYAYGLNGPLAYTDPYGLYAIAAGGSDFSDLPEDYVEDQYGTTPPVGPNEQTSTGQSVVAAPAEATVAAPRYLLPRAVPFAAGTVVADTPAPGPADIAAGAILVGAGLCDLYTYATSDDGPSVDDPDSWRGVDPEEAEDLVSEHYSPGEASRKGGGTRYADPARKGDQIRVMPGNPNDSNPVKRGPYLRISKNG